MRSRVMKDAHKRYAEGQRLRMGWSWSQCLKTAWAAERLRNAAPRGKGRDILHIATRRVA